MPEILESDQLRVRLDGGYRLTALGRNHLVYTASQLITRESILAQLLITVNLRLTATCAEAACMREGNLRWGALQISLNYATSQRC